MSSSQYIVGLSAKNIGAFSELKIKFNPGVNVIVGPNGCGKSTILKIIAMSFGQDFLDYKLGPFSAFATIVKHEGQTCCIGIAENSFKPDREYRKTEILQWSPLKAFESFGQTIDKVYIPGNFYHAPEFNFAPLVIGPNRSIEHITLTGMQREGVRTDKIQYYRHQGVSNLRSSKLPSPKQWMINRYFQYEKTWAVDYKYNFDKITTNLNQIAPKNSKFEFVSVEQDLEPKFRINDDIVYLEQISSGFQSILSIVFGIVEWIESVNVGEMRHIDKAVGTVLIDELDAHLHPEWQQTILDSLRNLFPKLQIIVTSHSPQIAMACKENELIVLPDHSGHVDVEPSKDTFRGWGVENTLITIMGMDDVRRSEFNSLYEKIQMSIQQKNSKLFELQVAELEDLVSSDDPIPQLLRLQFAKNLGEL